MSDSHNRLVKGYLKPKIFTLFEGYVAKEGVSESEALNIMATFFFQQQTDRQRINLINAARLSEAVTDK